MVSGNSSEYYSIIPKGEVDLGDQDIGSFDVTMNHTYFFFKRVNLRKRTIRNL